MTHVTSARQARERTKQVKMKQLVESELEDNIYLLALFFYVQIKVLLNLNSSK